MIWVCLAFSLTVVMVQGPKLLRQKLWTDLFVQLTLLGIGVVFGALVSLNWWYTVDVLAPIKLVFTPLSHWLYALV